MPLFGNSTKSPQRSKILDILPTLLDERAECGLARAGTYSTAKRHHRNNFKLRVY
jgi:hypothetical protein